MMLKIVTFLLPQILMTDRQERKNVHHRKYNTFIRYAQNLKCLKN